jgi:hypothetical protein
MKQIAEALGGPIGNVIMRAFDRMDMAERIIKKTKAPRDTFKWLCPTAPIQELDTKVYQNHCTELCRRARAGEDMRPATEAELLGILMAFSLKAPLTESYQFLYERLFNSVMGTAVYQRVIGKDLPPREPYTGFYQETVDELRRKSSFRNDVEAT